MARIWRNWNSLWKKVWQFLIKLNRSVTLLGIILGILYYIRYIQEKIQLSCTRTFVALRCTVAKTWRQHKHLSTGKWINSGIVLQRNTAQQWIETKLLICKQQGWISRPLCWMKEGRHKIIRSMWFHLLETNLGRNKIRTAFKGIQREKRGLIGKRHTQKYLRYKLRWLSLYISVYVIFFWRV